MLRIPVPYLLALADLAAILAYAIEFEPAYAQGSALILKLCLLPLAQPSASILNSRMFVLGGITCACLLSLIFSNGLTTFYLVQNAAFLAHLGLTLLILTHATTAAYVRTVACTVSATSVTFILMVLIGLVPDHYGRLLYFNGIHPNVGAEIATVGVICAAIAYRIRPFLMLATPPIATAFLMSGRSALIACALVLLLKAGYIVYSTARSRRRRSSLMILIPVACALTAYFFPILLDAMIISDPIRGTGSGFVGRTDRWQTAWADFIDNPLTGTGLGYYAALDKASPHNFFLYGLAEMGLLSLFVFGALAFLYARAAREHRWHAFYLAPAVILMIFNDRFLNLNPYPFVIFVLLFALSVGARAPVRAREKVARMRTGLHERAC